MSDLVELAGDIFLLDLKECGQEGKTAGYFLRGKNAWMLLETGPASSAGNVLEATRLLGIKPRELKYIAVTHIHLDHAGGLGTIAKHFPEAGLVLHPAGARHMIDPSRLIAGALKAWGREKMDLFGEVIPVAEERIICVSEGDAINLGERKIAVWETPGHCKNHVCFYDEKTGGLFCGDAAGVFYPALSQLLQRPVVRPATPAPDFNGELMLKSLARMALAKVESVYYSHFGVARPPRPMLENIAGQVSIFMELGKKYKGHDSPGAGCENADGLEMFAHEMKCYITESILGRDNLLEGADSKTKKEWGMLLGSIGLSSSGIWQYLEKSCR